MADDVKVKFGGDFSGISEGAASAGKIAGTALSSSFKAYADGVKASLANMFSVTNIMGKVLDGVKDALKYFREVDELSRQLGVSRVDLQKFGKIGAEVGISMETMGRSIQFANKTIGAATIAAGAQRETLKTLGFTEEQITSGRVDAIEVMMKLAGEYDKHIDRNVIAKHTVDMFGRSGGELTKVLSEGTTALRERIEAMKVYSEQEVKAAAAADRAIERGERAAKAAMKNFAVNAGVVYTSAVIDNAYRNSVEKEFKGKVGFFDSVVDPSAENVAKNTGSVTRIAKEIAKKARQKGLTTEDAMVQLNKNIEEDSGSYSQSTLDLMSQVAGKLQYMTEQEKKGSGPQASLSTDEKEAMALSTSTLQAIGGGDIGSIMSGFHVDIQQEQLDVQKQIATNTTPSPAGTDKTIVNVAK